jgi:hypothetical protein
LVAAALTFIPVKKATFNDEYKGWLRALRDLDKTLEQLECYSEVYANLGCTGELLERTRAMAKALPEFFLHEDAEISVVERVRPEFTDCAHCVRKDRGELGILLDRLAAAIEALPWSEDLAASIYAVKEQGNDFVRRFGTHLAREQTARSAIL